MPANRYGGGGRYYHPDGEGRNNKSKINTTAIPHAHAKSDKKIDKEIKPKPELSPSKQQSLKKDDNSKFKPAFDESGNKNSGGDHKAEKSEWIELGIVYMF